MYRPDPERMIPVPPHMLHILIAAGPQPLTLRELFHRVRGMSGLRLSEGSLERTLAWMKLERLVAVVTTDGAHGRAPDSERRYELTEFGQQVLRTEADRLCALLRLMNENELSP